VELHAALHAVGATGAAGSVGASAAAPAVLPAGVLAIAPLAKTAPQLMSAGAVATGWSYASAVASVTGLLTVLTLAVPPLRPADGASLVDARAAREHDPAQARRSPYRIAPRSTPVPSPVRVSTPVRPTRAPDARVPSPRPGPAPSASARAALDAAGAPPTLPQHDWIHAPAPTPALASAPTSPRPPSVGLDDEVLAATSVEPQMRLSPASGAARRPWALVPAARAAGPRTALSARRSDR